MPVSHNLKIRNCYLNAYTCKIIYWVATGLLTALLLMSSAMYIFKNEAVRETFVSLGYPAYLIYPLVLAKILGLIAILTKKSAILKEWAYAGFFFDFLLALGAHLSVGDGDFPGAVIALILLLISYFYDKKVFVAK